MDKFYTQTNCDHCGKSLISGRIMSMYNVNCICIECKKKERLRDDYKQAQEVELAEVQKGNRIFKGING